MNKCYGWINMGFLDKIFGKSTSKENSNIKGSVSVTSSKSDSNSEDNLVELAKNSPDMNEREKAIYKINDQNLLKEIYDENLKQDKNSLNKGLMRNVFYTLVSKITDEKFLIDIVKSDIDSQIRYYAIKNPNLQDEQVLIEIAKDNSIRYSNEYKRDFVIVNDDNVRMEAISKINDITVLQDIKENDVKNPRVQKIASERIQKLSTDDEVNNKLQQHIDDDLNNSNIDTKQWNKEDLELVKKMKTTLNPYSIEKEVRNIEDNNVLTYIMYNISEPRYRQFCLKNLSDEKVIIDVAKNDDDFTVRLNAIDKDVLSNEDLFYIVKNDETFDVVKSAVQKINDKEVLNKILNQELNIKNTNQVRQENQHEMIKNLAKEKIKSFSE